RRGGKKRAPDYRVVGANQPGKGGGGVRQTLGSYYPPAKPHAGPQRCETGGEYIARGLVDKPDEVRVTESEDRDRVIVRLDVADDDWGKVIGKGGRIAAAMRSLVKVAAVKED